LNISLKVYDYVFCLDPVRQIYIFYLELSRYYIITIVKSTQSGSILKFTLENRHAQRATANGKDLIIFSSNDYLGLSAHPEVFQAALDAGQKYGAGTGGAPGTTGTITLHEKLKETVAAFKSREMAVLFPSGYQANQALHHALDGERTVFYIDNRHHPSALDGVRLAKNSRVVRFDHTDIEALRGAVLAHRGMDNIVSLPSVFTVDGDIAPLDKIAVLKKDLGFLLLLDEAHATGCIGETGRGLEEHFGLKGTADFIMGTFSKALGSQGGFLAHNRDRSKYLKSQFRALEYSTSLSALCAGAALKALEILENEPSFIKSLQKNKKSIIENFAANNIPLIYKESMIMLLPYQNTDALQAALFDKGFLTISVKAQLTGKIQSCLRITPMATHTKDEIKQFTEAVKTEFQAT
jgi:8-amino-7-oxononanoate synthase